MYVRSLSACPKNLSMASRGVVVCVLALAVLPVAFALQSDGLLPSMYLCDGADTPGTPGCFVRSVKAANYEFVSRKPTAQETCKIESAHASKVSREGCTAPHPIWAITFTHATIVRMSPRTHCAGSQARCTSGTICPAHWPK